MVFLWSNCVQYIIHCILFQTFVVDTLAFDEALSTFRDLTSHKIGSLCKCVSLSKVEDVEAYMPVICAFTVEDEILDIISQLHE